jgi:hypothetical protein
MVLQRDMLGAIVASSAIVGVLGVSFVIGPRAGQVPQPSAEPAVAAPAPVERPAAPAEPDVRTEEVAARAVPLAVRIGTISVDAPIVPVGIQDDGAMVIPERVDEIGWYDPGGLGVVPGTAGTAVLAGHVDSRSQGRGALYDLRELRVGATIEVDLDDGTTQRWLITEVVQYSKAVLPLAEIFTWAGPSRLAVITCGGEFDRTARSYTDNLVVYAEPMDDLPGA